MGKREVELEWLREVMQLDEKYPSIKDLKRWVIVPAVEQINEHSPFNVEWSQRKTGRKVTHIVFTFTPKQLQTKPRQSIEKGGNEKMFFGFPKSVLDESANPGETYQMVANRLRNNQ